MTWNTRESTLLEFLELKENSVHSQMKSSFAVGEYLSIFLFQPIKRQLIKSAISQMCWNKKPHTYTALELRRLGDRWDWESAMYWSHRRTPRPSVTRQGLRLTSACLVAVRKHEQGFLGNGRYKRWQQDRAADSKLSDTLTDVRLCRSHRGTTEKRPLNKRSNAKLSVQCPRTCSL